MPYEPSNRSEDIVLSKGRRMSPAHHTLPGPTRVRGHRKALEYETKDLPKKESFRKEMVGKQVRRESATRRHAEHAKREIHALGVPGHKTRKVTSTIKPGFGPRKGQKYKVTTKAPDVRTKSAAKRIHGVRAAQRYLGRAAKAATKPGRLRKFVGRAAKGLGGAIGVTAAEVGAQSIGLPPGAAKVAEDAGYGTFASGAKVASKLGRAGVVGVAVGIAGATSAASIGLGKRHGKARAHQQRTQMHASEYTKAKTWKATRRAAFRSGIAKPGNKAMSLDEAGDILKSHRRK
jgi:hypothetical protein